MESLFFIHEEPSGKRDRLNLKIKKNFYKNNMLVESLTALLGHISTRRKVRSIGNVKW